MMMKKLITLTAALAVLLTGGVAQAEIKFRIGHNAPVADPRTFAAETFRDQLKELVGDEVKVEIFPAGQLGSLEEMYQGLKLGTVEAVLDDPGSLQSFHAVGAIGFTPFLYRDMEHYTKVWNSEAGPKILQIIAEKTGIYQIGRLDRGARNISSIRPIHKLEDFKGLKIRVPNSKILIDGFAALGASPTPMTFTEVFNALQYKVIDAQENPLDLIWNNSMYQVSPNIVLTNHVFSSFFFQMSKKTFDSYPENIRKALLEAAERTSKIYNARVEQMQKDSLEKLRGADKVTIIELDKGELKRIQDQARTIYVKYPDLVDIIKMIDAY